MSNKSTQRTVKRKKVTFNLDATHTKEVLIAGDFNDWNPEKHPMKQKEDGSWQKSLMLPSGTADCPLDIPTIRKRSFLCLITRTRVN